MINNVNRVIVGIDISTVCLGISIVSYDGEKPKLLYISHIKPKISNKKIKGAEALFIKSKIFKDSFSELCNNLGINKLITDVVIEEPLPGGQNVRTVNTLLKFNGMISESVYELTNVVPQYISSYEARKFAFPELMAIRKYNKKGESYCYEKIKKSIENNELVLFGNYPYDCAKKYILWNKISEQYNGIQWIYDKNGELKTENFDASDSLVCILGQIGKEKFENSEPKILNFNELKTDSGSNKILYYVEFCGKQFDKVIEFD